MSGPAASVPDASDPGGPHRDPCVFCAIVHGTAPAEIVAARPRRWRSSPTTPSPAGTPWFSRASTPGISGTSRPRPGRRPWPTPTSSPPTYAKSTSRPDSTSSSPTAWRQPRLCGTYTSILSPVGTAIGVARSGRRRIPVTTKTTGNGEPLLFSDLFGVCGAAPGVSTSPVSGTWLIVTFRMRGVSGWMCRLQ